jgi:hypothetical protein
MKRPSLSLFSFWKKKNWQIIQADDLTDDDGREISNPTTLPERETETNEREQETNET